MATNREMQAERTRNNLYIAALDLIKAKGYENVSVEDITNAAGVAKGTFYTHFRSKENLLYYTYVYLNDCYTRALAKAEKCSTFYDTFDTFVFESYKEIARMGRNVLRALGNNMFNEESRQTFLDRDRGLYTSLRYLIGRGREEGLIDPAFSDEQILEAFVATIVGVENYWALSDSEEDLASFAHRSVGMLLSGFIKEK